MNEKKNTDGKFLLGFVVGSVIGALVLFFLGTKEGKKTGKLFEEKGKDLIDEIGEKLSDLEEKGKDLVEKGEAVKEDLIEQLEDKKEELTRETTKKIDTALAHIEELQERGRQTTATLRRRFKNIPKKS